jgi:small subunit ribosomal protein S8
MTVTDPIADMLTRTRNALSARHDMVRIPASKMKIAVAQVLKDEGFITDFQVLRTRPQPMLLVRLKYRDDKNPIITGLKRVSKPGLRVYVDKGEIPRVYGGVGVAVLSTSEGIMTGQEARRRGIGGELLCHVW